MKRALHIMLAIATASPLAALTQEDVSQNRQKFVSPDGRFGIHQSKEEDVDGIVMTRVDLVEVKSGTKLCELGTLGNPWAADIRILWSPDSRRLAFVSPSRRGDWTDVWVLKDKSFEQVNLPEMPSLDMKRDHRRPAGGRQNIRSGMLMASLGRGPSRHSPADKNQARGTMQTLQI